eukprot:m.27735 g.27735  ORF g.27735 m.27735 type:complete len:375 (-) comp13476_c0_seq6:323-1447(-)
MFQGHGQEIETYQAQPPWLLLHKLAPVFCCYRIMLFVTRHIRCPMILACLNVVSLSYLIMKGPAISRPRVQDHLEALCMTADSARHGDPAILLIMIFTTPTQTGRERREAMRRTWLNYGDADNHYGKISHKFMIGTKSLQSTDIQALNKEHQKYNDIALMENVQENWTNLTGKLLESFTWLLDHVAPFDYIMKVDDDSFVRVDYLMKELVHIPPHDVNRVYWGYFDGKAPIKTFGKYAEQEWNLCDTYLPYALGGGYVVSTALIKLLAQQREELAQHLAEDASLGLWLSNLNITRKHDVRFDTESTSRGCLNHHIVMHKLSQESMIEKYNWLLETRGLQHCRHEFRERKEYVYAWDKLPRDCCPGRRQTESEPL